MGSLEEALRRFRLGGAGRPHAADDSDDPPPGVSAAEARELFALAAHPTDTQVKPIVLNRRIESVPEAHFDAAALPFEALAISDVLAAPQPELEAFLTRVYRSVAHSSPVNEKVNTLAYFETLCCDTAAANVLINSSLMTLFVRMLRASKAPALRPAHERDGPPTEARDVHHGRARGVEDRDRADGVPEG